MRVCSDFAGGNGAPLVDKMIGDAFLTVKAVADNIAAVSYVAANMEAIVTLAQTVVAQQAQIAALTARVTTLEGH